ncbi:bifunctional adenosylcobinamide kinase/adenosylcobinamide-phosphate guanylyltransferase [Sphingomonas sp. FW199]|uniref:bifunctional adenosylcobinamide kinase/adenosylcobinamide-phosphate guanylyltransferase n=1 Tax=Sphingomonas sp. FW199 TaxID=3400217 RepID=UPI003CF13A33
MLTFILGGARSGKSRRAQAMAEATSGRLIFIATAQAFDAEMTDRIERHRLDRDSRWMTVEAPVDLADAIRVHGSSGNVLLVDCLTLWLSNLLIAEADIDMAADDLIDALAAAPCPVFVVSNEVGLGIVPDNALARQFRDHAGRLHQRIAAQADHVEWMVAGLSLRMK